MKQEQGCGLGCFLVVLVIGVVLLCLFLPFVGLPLGLILVIVVVLFARSQQNDEEEEEEEDG